MKKLILLLLVIGSVFGTIETAHAGWSTTKRKNCWFLGKRYVAQGHLGGWLCRWGYVGDRRANCSGVSIWLDRFYGCCSRQSQVYAYAYGGGQGGWVNRPCWGVSAAELTDMLVDAGFAAAAEGGDDEMVPDPGIPAWEPGAYQQENGINASFDPGVVMLRDIKIRLISTKVIDAASAGVDNSVTATLWEETLGADGGGPVGGAGAEDPEIREGGIVRTSTVSLIGGSLVITGDIFTEHDFKWTYMPDGSVMVTYVGGDKALYAGAAGSISDGLAFTMSGDIKGGEGAGMARLAAETEGSAVLNLYPNPAASTLQVSLEQADAAAVTVGIYDLSGKRVKTLETLPLSNGAARLSIDISTLPAGSYYLMVKGEGLRIVKQFTKQ